MADVCSDTESGNSGNNEHNNNTPQKKKRKVNYKHNYNKKWEKQYSWIKASEKGCTYFYCKTCTKHLIGGSAAVLKHNQSVKHINSSKQIKFQKPVSELFSVNKTLERQTKEAEIRISSFIIEHNLSFNIVDHLSELIKELSKTPEAVKSIHLGRTKCTAIAKNVLGLTSLQVLVKKLQVSTFSLLIDESTDHAAVKNLGIVVRTVNDTGNSFVLTDDFLALLPIENATAQVIYNVISNFFENYNIPYKKNLIGFSADGANTMMGGNHSVQILLKKDIPSLFVLKCICHSLALCSSNACLKLPRSPEDLVRNIHSYFQFSYKRQAEFKEFQSFTEAKPHKLLYPSQTRWLSLLSVVKRSLEQYNALKLYFQSQYLVDKVQQSEIIYHKLNDPLNKCYLLFLEFILPFINDLNLEFQSESPKIYLLYSKMSGMYKSILECYMQREYLISITDIEKIDYKNPHKFLKINDIYLGPKLYIELQSNIYSEEQKTEFRRRCLDFLIECARQINLRFSFSEMKSLKLLNFLLPSNFENVVTLAPLMQYFPNFIDDLNNLDKEWRILRNSDISKSEDVLVFWREILNLKTGDGNLFYPNLNKLIKSLLCLPHSSACVERLFSQINLTKTKLRNRLNSETLSGILHSKRLISQGNSCYKFDVTNEILVNFTGKMYSDKS